MIRLASAEDICSIVELRIKLIKEVNGNIEDSDLNKLSKALNRYLYDGLSNGNVVVFLAEEDGKIVAISVMCFYNIIPLPSNIDGKMALLSDMYTLPEYRNKGLGMNLLIKIMDYAKKLGYKKVILNATESGRRLYLKYGFKDVTGEMSYKFI